MKTRSGLFLLALAAACYTGTKAKAQTIGTENWKQIVADRLPLYGHRNWIVIADSAYPAQSRDGIETIVSNADQLEVAKYVLGLISKARHVRPTVYLDQELKYVPETDAQGISTYRDTLHTMLKDHSVNVLPHEQIIGKLDQISQTFRVLIVKTNLAIPYTSIFLQLDCAYWPADAETRLRKSMNGGK